MDRISDNWKKYPLLVVGELPFTLPGAVSLLPSNVGGSEFPSLNDFYIIISVDRLSIDAAISLLESTNVSPDQMIVFLSAELSFDHPKQAFMGVMENIEGENADEFRARLLGRLECQRQKKLLFAMHEASQLGIARRLNETELCHTLDITRIAHALACGYGLSPESHRKVLRACLEGMITANISWDQNVSIEKLIPEAGAFILECAAKGINFRDALKERASALSFRARTDLLHQIENCLGLLLGGKNNAA